MTEKNNSPAYLIKHLDKKHEKQSFSCGIVELDTYLHRQASQDIKKYVSVTHVLTQHDSNVVLGYYSLSSTGIPVGELPEETVKKLPKYPIVPAILLGRLAVDKKSQGNKIGELLLLDAFKRSLGTSEEIGAAAIVVDAKNKQAASFYKRYEFIEFHENHHKLFLPLSTLKLLSL